MADTPSLKAKVLNAEFKWGARKGDSVIVDAVSSLRCESRKERSCRCEFRLRQEERDEDI